MTLADTINLHILIVEDSPTQAERLRYILKQRDFHVSAARNGREALAAARSEPPALIITDIVMPEMDGYELCQNIKADQEMKSIPVILVTTLSDPQDVIRGLECGADNFVVKPYDESYLLSRIDHVLLNNKFRRNDPAGEPIEISFSGKKRVITAGRLQILNLLLSTYEAATQRNHELTLTKDALRASNESLEAANKELEAFSYSVSHDLRAPLRAIEGFTQNLLDDPNGNWSKDAIDLLNRSRNACLRMKHLIEDLLDLSRISQGQLKREPVDLSQLVSVILTDLQRLQPARQSRITVNADIFANCDLRLLRIVLENLLGNAWKFSSKKAVSEIEFGSMLQGQQTIYFVRDNGAGFDMQYAKRLFGAFQRLHSTDEFPGTGIGLATVNRIIHRHGGRIWAESQPTQGATFYFSL